MPSLNTIAVAGLLAAGIASAQNSTVQCASGLKMFVSRGTGEDMGLGATSGITDAILELIDGSDAEPILYPAANGNSSNDDPSYFQSVGNGTMLLREKMTEYAEACPDSPMAIFGYSQGAQITSNNLCGTPPIWSLYSGVTDIETVLAMSLPMSAEETRNIVAVVLLGDTTHRSEANYNYGNSTGSGIFWRNDISTCEDMGNRLRSYCDQGDPFCDVGAIPNAYAHVTYVPVHGEEIVEYVVEQYRNGGDAGNTNSPDSPAATPGAEPPSAASGLSASLLAVVVPVLALAMM